MWAVSRAGDFPWPPSFSRPDTPCQSCLDVVLEAFRAQDPTLVQSRTDLLQHARVELLSAQVLIDAVSLVGRAAEGEIEGMILDHGVVLATRMPPIARPRVLLRTLHHARPDRVEFNIPITRQEIALSIHQTGPVSPFPQRPCPLIRCIDILHVPPTERLHDFGDTRGLTRLHEHMDMIGHQDIGVHRATMGRRRLVETRKVKTVIVGMEKDGLPIMTALDDMLWNIGEHIPGCSGHHTPPHGSG